MKKRLVAAIITTDLRDDHRRYSDPEPSFGAAPGALLEGFAQNPDCTVHVISCVQHPVASPQKIAENIYYHSVNVGKWGWLRGLYIGCILAVRRKLREIGPDIVHGQGTERYCSLAAVFSGFPNVMTIHGNMKSVSQVLRAKWGSFYWLAAKLENLALKKAGGVFCNSTYTEELVAPRTAKTWRVANALSGIYFRPLAARSHVSRPVLVNIGHVTAYKRQLELLRLAEELHAAGCVFEMQFAGRCARGTAYCCEFLDRMKIAEQTGYARYLGEKSAMEILEILDNAQAMVHFPSEEAFGLAAAEGLARNLKFFGSRTGGIVDIASHVEGAELAGVNDWNGLRQAIMRWLESGAPLPRSASTEMKLRYHPDGIAARHQDIYREFLNLSENVRDRE